MELAQISDWPLLVGLLTARTGLAGLRTAFRDLWIRYLPRSAQRSVYFPEEVGASRTADYAPSQSLEIRIPRTSADFRPLRASFSILFYLSLFVVLFSLEKLFSQTWYVSNPF